MKTTTTLILLLVSALSGCLKKSSQASQTLANGNAHGQFKGYGAVSDFVNQRLIGQLPVTAQSYGLNSYVNYDGNLTALLGTYITTGGTTFFQNAVPNALNMSLWNTIFAGFGADSAKHCDGPGAAPFTGTEVFLKALAVSCKWPAAEAKSEAAMRGLWQAVMGYQAPEEEYKAWSDEFSAASSDYAQAQPKAAVAAMLNAAMMNPYFLLTP